MCAQLYEHAHCKHCSGHCVSIMTQSLTIASSLSRSRGNPQNLAPNPHHLILILNWILPILNHLPSTQAALLRGTFSSPSVWWSLIHLPRDEHALNIYTCICFSSPSQRWTPLSQQHTGPMGGGTQPCVLNQWMRLSYKSVPCISGIQLEPSLIN